MRDIMTLINSPDYKDNSVLKRLMIGYLLRLPSMGNRLREIFIRLNILTKCKAMAKLLKNEPKNRKLLHIQ